MLQASGVALEVSVNEGGPREFVELWARHVD